MTGAETERSSLQEKQKYILHEILQNFSFHVKIDSFNLQVQPAEEKVNAYLKQFYL